MKDLLSIVRLNKFFPLPKTSLFQRQRPVLRANDDISLVVREGETFGLVGESGSGKSTLGRCLLQLTKPTSGQVVYHGEKEGFTPRYLQTKKMEENRQTTGAGIDLTRLSAKEMRLLRKDLQIVFQDPYSSLNPRMTVGQILEEGVAIHTPYKKGTRQMQEYVLKVMEECGLQAHMLHRYPHQFSGGQRQRICIARALAVKPKFVVCDECVSALDVSIQAQILNLLSDLKEREKLTYLFISHDLSVVRYISDRIAVMYLGKIVELGETEQIFQNPCHPYTQTLLAALPSYSTKRESIASFTLQKYQGKDVQRVPVPMIEVEKGHLVRMDFEK
ncbi:MAG: ABC transporter ATP-binding protein [Clostridia bacterium]|nr:ABC transporter ATP-binding protein [Clostridia bacterium]